MQAETSESTSLVAISQPRSDRRSKLTNVEQIYRLLRRKPYYSIRRDGPRAKAGWQGVGNPVWSSLLGVWELWIGYFALLANDSRRRTLIFEWKL